MLRAKAPFPVRLGALCCAAGALRLLGPPWLLVGAADCLPAAQGRAAAQPAAPQPGRWGLFLPLVEVVAVEITVALHSRVRRPGEGAAESAGDGETAAALPVCLELFEGAVEALAASQEEEAAEEEAAAAAAAQGGGAGRAQSLPPVPFEVAERALTALSRLAGMLCEYLEWELFERDGGGGEDGAEGTAAAAEKEEDKEREGPPVLSAEGAAVARALGCLLAEVPAAAPDGFRKVLAGLLSAETAPAGSSSAAAEPALAFLLPALVQMTDTAEASADLCDAFVESGGCGAVARIVGRAAAGSAGAEASAGEGAVRAACGVVRNVLQRAVLAEARDLDPHAVDARRAAEEAFPGVRGQPPQPLPGELRGDDV